MRLVTRSDFDGLICAALLKQVETIDSIQFVHPKDVQDGKIAVTDQDILTNVPYVPGCGLWFDHHHTEIDRMHDTQTEYKGVCRIAPSASRVVYDYYGGAERFPGMETLLSEVDKADSAAFTRNEILYPTGWPLMSFLMDARTGLGRFHDYRISNYQLMMDLIEACTHMTVDEILELPDVKERVIRYFDQDPLFRAMVAKHTRIVSNVIVTDLRGVDPIYCSNRFMVYALYPEQNCSIWTVSGVRNQNCVFACGHSILNRTAKCDVGDVMSQLGGGGHSGAGTCQVPHDAYEKTLQTILDAFVEPAE